MSLPITARVKRTGTKKGCGCTGSCNCGKTPAKMKDLSGDGKVTQKDVLIGRGVIDAPGKMYNSPAKMWGAAKVAHGKKSSPAKMGCYGKKK